MSFATFEQDVAALVLAAVTAADPAARVSSQIAVSPGAVTIAGESYTPARIFVVSVGKAAVAMATAAASILGDTLTAGVVISKATAVPDLPPPLRYFPGSHPLPSQLSLQATQAVYDLMAETQPNDLVLCLISGGASALLTRPVLPLAQWQALNDALLRSGCAINDVNTIRQQFDTVKGGGLAQWAAPATCVSLILSDVIGNRLAHIGSGPTVPTPPDPQQARAILDAYQVWARLDEVTAAAVTRHLAATIPHQPAAGNLIRNHIIGDVSLAAEAAARRAEQLGFQTAVVSTTLTGEARDIGRMAADRVRQTPPGHCLIWGGESTVTVTGAGLGGRNQEVALAAAVALSGTPGCVVASFATDGEDGPTPVAGAVVSGETAVQAARSGLDPAAYLANNDSYHFFQRLGAGHLSAPTGTNVNDLLVALTYATDS